MYVKMLIAVLHWQSEYNVPLSSVISMHSTIEQDCVLIEVCVLINHGDLGMIWSLLVSL